MSDKMTPEEQNELQGQTSWCEEEVIKLRAQVAVLRSAITGLLGQWNMGTVGQYDAGDTRLLYARKDDCVRALSDTAGSEFLEASDD